MDNENTFTDLAKYSPDVHPLTDGLIWQNISQNCIRFWRGEHQRTEFLHKLDPLYTIAMYLKNT